MLTLLTMGALAIAAVSVSSHSVPTRPDSSVVTESRAERSNPRVSGRRSVANASRLAPAARAMSLLVSVTVDRTDDNPSASACTAAANDCSLRGAVAFANLNVGTTINVPAGTYQLNIAGGALEGFSGDDSIGDLDVTATTTSISGAGAATTIIQQTKPDDRVIEVNPFLDADFSFSMSGVTISGGHETQSVGGGGIISGSINNSVTVTNCIFSGNSATGAGSLGGGGIAHTGGNLTVTGTTFNSNSSTSSGGAISYSAGDPFGRTPSTGTLTVSGSTFSSNSSSSTAAGGGALDLYNFNLGTGSYSVNSSSFSGNNASGGSGGAIIVESGPLTVTTSSFSGNTAAQRGGAIDSSDNTSVTFSRLVGNSVTLPVNGLTLFRGAGTLTADDNWWGSNSGPSANDFRSTSGSVTPATYLQLRISASPNTICTGASSTLTADIKQRSSGPSLTTELNGLPAFPVPPATIFSNAVLGTLSGASTQYVNGAATATYTAGGTGGMGSADATADSQTVTATITIASTTTTDPADQAVCQGATASFSTTASGPGPFSYAWTLDGSPFNGNSDNIMVPTGSLSIGSHTVMVTTTGLCGSASQSATLTVQAPTTTTDPADATVCQGVTANFSTTAGGTGPFSYAWTLDGSPFNGNSPSINVPTGSLSLGSHSVMVTTTGACGSASQSATLTVQATTTTTDPADATVCQGATANFSTTAGGTGPFSYAWTLDGSPFNGNSPSINVPTGSLSVGSHTVAVTTTGNCGSASQSATLTVQATTSTTDPTDVTVCQGATANFSTTASGTGPFSYAWTLDGSPFNGNSPSINVPTGSLSVGSHTVAVTTTGTCGSASQSATLTVQATTTTTDPADVTVCQGATASFSTTAGGTGPFHYAWTLDGLPFNGDSPNISVPTGSLSQGAHSVVVMTTGFCGSASQSATLTVQNTPPVITLSTNNINLWPPNHAYHTFNVTDFVASATSSCDGNITSSVVIASISSDEPEDNLTGADGSTLNDIVIAADCKSAQLRAERDGNLNGRVYTITFKVTDSAGNTTTATATVSVPLNQNGAAAVNDGAGAGYTVNSACP
ncbi:MAG TPA: hypothetical protein VKC61_04785 [Pyrinomonadaceae bacterium]|nr:hypothetical protein [Pyrinomonadaceae bacterium]